MKKIMLITVLSLLGANAFATSTECINAINKLTEESISYGQGLQAEKLDDVTTRLTNEKGEKSLAEAMEKAVSVCK